MNMEVKCVYTVDTMDTLAHPHGIRLAGQLCTETKTEFFLRLYTAPYIFLTKKL